MNRVIDASVACKWFFEENLSAEARALAAADTTLLAPDLIVAECANVAWRRATTGSVPLAQAEALVAALPAWFAALTPCAQLREAAFRIARQLNHPVYDCFYVALAAQDASPLVTADAALVRRIRNSPWDNLVEPLGQPPAA